MKPAELLHKHPLPPCVDPLEDAPRTHFPHSTGGDPTATTTPPGDPGPPAPPPAPEG